jgi:hypothetical protein
LLHVHANAPGAQQGDCLCGFFEKERGGRQAAMWRRLWTPSTMPIANPARQVHP